VWDYLRTAELDTAYANMLAKIDISDTLIAVATNGT
jgi:sulfur carrier protein ThiS